MIKILFQRNEKAFLPEIDAYIKYFNKIDGFSAFDSSKLSNSYDIKEFDVIWEFKGIGGIKTKDQILIHEYASLSTGIFPLIKNKLKEKINYKPDLRVFLNENVKSGYNFNDNVDYCFRDMGVDEHFLSFKNVKKEYDFVYIGPITKSRKIDKLLEIFTNKSNGKFCLVGNVENDIFKKYKNNKDIIFTGKVPYLEVPQIASKAVYGVNFIPNKYPYNIQTSTKLLEYLALDLKVITTDYLWVRQFEKKYNCSFFKLDNNNMKFDINNINKFDFISNYNSSDFLWDSIIEQSNVLKKIKNLINNGN